MRLASGTRSDRAMTMPNADRGTGPVRIAARISALALCAGLGLAGCAQVAAVNLGTSAPTTAVANTTPDSRGVITYASYQVVVGREGDTITTVANRLGISPTELGNRNSLPVDYRLRAGEVLLLPTNFPRSDPGALGGDVSTEPLAWSPERASQAIDGGATASAAAGGTATSAAPRTNPFQNGQADPLIDPVRHRVEAGETAYSIARLYGVSVTALASWNGLGPDLAVRTNQELLIPIVGGANQISGGSDTQPGQTTAVAAPASAAAALPEDIVAATPPASPDMGQYRTPQGGALNPPVTGTINRPYNASNPNGIGYAVAAGAPVKAAAAGEVALISEELGGQGTIVLIRHQDDLMTTYSTLSGVTVKKGDSVQSGQTIGTVASRDKPELQFDVFRGTTSIDPTTYLK